MKLSLKKILKYSLYTGILNQCVYGHRWFTTSETLMILHAPSHVLCVFWQETWYLCCAALHDCNVVWRRACLICTGMLILMAPALISRIDLRLNLHVSSKSKSTNPFKLATRPVRQAMEKAPGKVFVLCSNHGSGVMRFLTRTRKVRALHLISWDNSSGNVSLIKNVVLILLCMFNWHGKIF